MVSVTMGVGVHALGGFAVTPLEKHRRPSRDTLRSPALLSIGVVGGSRWANIANQVVG